MTAPELPAIVICPRCGVEVISVMTTTLETCNPISKPECWDIDRMMSGL